MIMDYEFKICPLCGEKLSECWVGNRLENLVCECGFDLYEYLKANK